MQELRRFSDFTRALSKLPSPDAATCGISTRVSCIVDTPRPATGPATPRYPKGALARILTIFRAGGPLILSRAHGT
jgi:hypothetical protein